MLKDVTKMPANLFDLYEKMLENSLRGLSGDQIRIIQALLTWLAFTSRPISLQEAMEVAQLMASTETSFVVEDEIFCRFSGYVTLYSLDLLSNLTK